MSGRPSIASNRLRMKESVVRSNIEYKNVVLLARHNPTAPDVLYRAETACITLSGFFTRITTSSAAPGCVLFLGRGVGDRSSLGGVLFRLRGDRLRGAVAEK